jgi:hypothetical protein
MLIERYGDDERGDRDPADIAGVWSGGRGEGMGNAAGQTV